MKNILKIFAIIFIVIGLLIFYQKYQEKQSPPSDQTSQNPAESGAQTQPQAISTPQPQAPPPPSQNLPQIPRTQPSRPTQPIPQPNIRPQYIDKRAEFLQAAQESGCKVVSYQQTGNSAMIGLESKDRNSLGDFLDVCVRKGLIRDFDDLKQFREKRVRDVTFFYAGYRLKW